MLLRPQLGVALGMHALSLGIGLQHHGAPNEGVNATIERLFGHQRLAAALVSVGDQPGLKEPRHEGTRPPGGVGDDPKLRCYLQAVMVQTEAGTP